MSRAKPQPSVESRAAIDSRAAIMSRTRVTAEAIFISFRVSSSSDGNRDTPSIPSDSFPTAGRTAATQLPLAFIGRPSDKRLFISA